MLSQSGVVWCGGWAHTHLFLNLEKAKKKRKIHYGGCLGDVQVEIVKNLVHKMFVRSFIRLLLSLKVCMCLCTEQKRRVENVQRTRKTFIRTHVKLWWDGLLGALLEYRSRSIDGWAAFILEKKIPRICIHKLFCSLYGCNSMKKFSVVRTYVNFSIFKYTFNHFFSWNFPFSTTFTAPTQPPHHLSLTHCNSRHPPQVPPHHRKQPAQLPNTYYV